MTTQYEPCEHEHKITARLYRCDKKEYCEKQKVYDGVNVKYCKRRFNWEHDNWVFEKTRNDIEVRARDGEEYHERSKYVNNRKSRKPIDPDISIGEGV